jgi:hypothetical protein
MDQCRYQRAAAGYEIVLARRSGPDRSRRIARKDKSKPEWLDAAGPPTLQRGQRMIPGQLRTCLRVAQKRCQLGSLAVPLARIGAGRSGWNTCPACYFMPL